MVDMWSHCCKQGSRDSWRGGKRSKEETMVIVSAMGYRMVLIFCGSKFSQIAVFDNFVEKNFANMVRSVKIFIEIYFAMAMNLQKLQNF